MLITGRAPEAPELRRFVNIQPVLDFHDLEPGGRATEAIRATIAKLGLTPDRGVRVRLTGPVALSDEEFATVADGAALNGVVTILVVLLVLRLALKQARIILAVPINLAVGLSFTAAIGLWMVGALNLISVAFAVLFVGLGVDFGIQFSVRYRAERYADRDLREALHAAARGVAGPLLLAAASIAAAFYSFLPTAYVGLSELGLIAGTGMIVAFSTTVTLLPALLSVLKPAGEPAPIGWAALAPLDRVLDMQPLRRDPSRPFAALAALEDLGLSGPSRRARRARQRDAAHPASAEGPDTRISGRASIRGAGSDNAGRSQPESGGAARQRMERQSGASDGPGTWLRLEYAELRTAWVEGAFVELRVRRRLNETVVQRRGDHQ